jgi:hypothetical protein
VSQKTTTSSTLSKPTVATYEAGGTYQMTLQGGAMHGSGSCQLSFSCDGGVNFKVVKSIMRNCPIAKEYSFTVPAELGGLGRTSYLFAWTWYVSLVYQQVVHN